MGSDVDIYKINRKEASKFLYREMSTQIIHTRKFKDFIDDRIKECGPSSSVRFDYEKIMSILKEDASLLYPDELDEIARFIDDETSNMYLGQEKSSNLSYAHNEALLKRYGIEHLFYNRGYSYMFLYGAFSYYLEPMQIRSDDYDGHNISSKDFLLFNDYVILVTKKLIESDFHNERPHTFTETELDIVNQILQDRSGDSAFFEAIENRFEDVKEAWIEAYKSGTQDSRDNPDSLTVAFSEDFFVWSIKFKQKIVESPDTRVIIYHSC